MKTRRLTLAVLPLLLLAAHAVHAQTRTTNKTTIDLNSGWTFRQAGKEQWRKATVPGSVHTDLLANELIEDPFYRDNEPKLQWIGKADWEYRTTFDAPAALLRRPHVEPLQQIGCNAQYNRALQLDPNTTAIALDLSHTTGQHGESGSTDLLRFQHR